MPLFKMTCFPAMAGSIKKEFYPESWLIQEISSDESEIKEGELHTGLVDLNNGTSQHYNFYSMEKSARCPVDALRYFYSVLLTFSVKFESGMFLLEHTPAGVYATPDTTNLNPELQYYIDNWWKIEFIGNVETIDTEVLQVVSSEGVVVKFTAHKSGSNAVEAFLKFKITSSGKSVDPI